MQMPKLHSKNINTAQINNIFMTLLCEFILKDDMEIYIYIYIKDAINSCDELNNINRYQYSSSIYKLIQLQSTATVYKAISTTIAPIKSKRNIQLCLSFSVCWLILIRPDSFIFNRY